MKLIVQEAPAGCVIACSASLAGLSYKKMRKYFDDGEMEEKTSGFYNRDIISALEKINIRAKAYSIKKWGNQKIKTGFIVFIGRSSQYPAGHYLLKTKRGWINSWINYPDINPAKAGFQKTLPGKIKWIIETER